MAVHLSKPPKPLRLTRTQSDVVKGLRWRSPEARREAKRKIEAIRRQAERDHLTLGPRIDTSLLRSPKVIIGILLTFLLLGGLITSSKHKPQQSATRLSFEQKRVRKSLKAAATAMTLYRVHTKGWPPQHLGLFALAKNYGRPGWKGPYINWAYKDPWSTPYIYRMPISPFEAPELFSCGPDTKPDTPDDIRMRPEDFTCNEGSWQRDAHSETTP